MSPFRLSTVHALWPLLQLADPGAQHRDWSVKATVASPVPTAMKVLATGSSTRVSASTKAAAVTASRTRNKMTLVLSRASSGSICSLLSTRVHDVAKAVGHSTSADRESCGRHCFRATAGVPATTPPPEATSPPAALSMPTGAAVQAGCRINDGSLQRAVDAPIGAGLPPSCNADWSGTRRRALEIRARSDRSGAVTHAPRSSLPPLTIALRPRMSPREVQIGRKIIQTRERPPGGSQLAPPSTTRESLPERSQHRASWAGALSTLDGEKSG